MKAITQLRILYKKYKIYKLLNDLFFGIVIWGIIVGYSISIITNFNINTLLSMILQMLGSLFICGSCFLLIKGIIVKKFNGITQLDDNILHQYEQWKIEVETNNILNKEINHIKNKISLYNESENIDYTKMEEYLKSLFTENNLKKLSEYIAKKQIVKDLEKDV